MDDKNPTPAEDLAAKIAAYKITRKVSAGPPLPASRGPVRLTCAMRARRAGLELSMDAVGKVVGIKITSLSFVERGGNVSLVSALKLAAFFGCTVEELWQLREAEKDATTND